MKQQFKIIENNGCPFYQLRDEFKLADNALILPANKPMCLDLSNAISTFMDIGKSIKIDEKGCASESVSFTCPGCTGSIRLGVQKGMSDRIFDDSGKQSKAGNIAKRLSNFSMFKTLSELDLKELIPLLKMKTFVNGEVIVKKGDSGRNLFIMTSGRVEVADEDGISIAFLEKGDIFGEMSLLSGDPAGANIKVVESAHVLSIDARDFRKVLFRYPSLQIYLARLLSKRLARANMARTVELSSVMSGTISETSPSELFQTCSINEKTGVLTLQLTQGAAELLFNKGKLVKVKYGEKGDKEAFFELLKEKNGRYNFSPGLSPEQQAAEEIGHIMCLLMDGLSKMDEEEFVKK